MDRLLRGRPARPARWTCCTSAAAGSRCPRYVAATRPGSDNLVLELDPALVDLDRRRLGLRTGPLLRVETGDARANLRRQPSASRDLIIGDAFGHLAVPWHLTTRELVTDVRRVLRPGGVYALNVIDGPARRFIRAEVATIAAVFPHVTLVAPLPALRGETGSNFVVFASTPRCGRAADSLTRSGAAGLRRRRDRAHRRLRAGRPAAHLGLSG